MAQTEGRLAFVDTSAEQLELEDRLQVAHLGWGRRPEAEAALSHTGEIAAILPVLICERRQLGDAQGVVPVRVDLLEVVAHVEHRKPIDLEGRLRLRRLGLRGVRVATERRRNIGDGALRPHAVAGLIERRGDNGDAELARRHGDDAAADAALGRKAGVVQPLSGVVVQSGGGHHGKNTGDLWRGQ